MNILIIQAAKLGDMVCTTPMFRAVKKTYPKTKLFVLGNTINKELLAGNPYIDEYLPGMGSKELRVFLKKQKIDAAVCTSPNPSALYELLRARIKKVVVPKIKGGWSPYTTKSYRLLSLFAMTVPIYFGRYMPRQYLTLLEPLGIKSDDTRKDMFFTAEALTRVETALAGLGLDSKKDAIVAIAPSAGDKSKTWKPERFAQLIQKLQADGRKPVLIGGKADRDESRAVVSAVKSPVPNLTEKLSIEELKAFMSLVKLVVAVDTGPIYIAEALGTSTVDIVGPMDEREQPPQGEMHRVVVPKERKAPAIHIMNAAIIDEEEARRQADAITVDMVMQAIHSLGDTIFS